MNRYWFVHSHINETLTQYRQYEMSHKSIHITSSHRENKLGHSVIFVFSFYFIGIGPCDDYQYSVQFPGTGKKPENKNQRGRSHKSLRDLNCVTAGASKGILHVWVHCVVHINNFRDPCSRIMNFTRLICSSTIVIVIISSLTTGSCRDTHESCKCVLVYASMRACTWSLQN